MPKSHLIDVRTPAEFLAGGALPGAINIEYQFIDLALEARPDRYSKDDVFTLYCRSGRRSGIALETLTKLGYKCVRDIGGLEEARRVWEREQENVEKVGKEEEESREEMEKESGGEVRSKGFGELVSGLRALEEGKAASVAG